MSKITLPEDPRELTIGQIIKLFLNLKYKTLVLIIAMVSSVLTTAFMVGRYTNQKQTAVRLNSPFAMRIDADGVRKDFDNIVLVNDPLTQPLDDKTVVLILREIKSSFDIVPIGKVIAKMDGDKLTGIWKLILSANIDLMSKAWANDEFNWYGHEQDTDFTEEFVNEDTVNRTYANDECVLEYRVDSERRSIPSSFKWIVLNH